MSKQDTFKSFGMEPCVLALTDLTPYARNSRTHSDSQVAEIAASIKEFGWRQPIVIDEGNTIRAGHGRFLAAQRLGLKEVPCLRGQLTETQWKAYVIADNRLAEKAGWDMSMLKLEIEELNLDNFNIELTGIDEEFFLQADLDIPDPINKDKEDNPYSDKVEKPLYEAKGNKPLLNELYDDSKAKVLLESIDKAKLDPQLKSFLRLAAYRHIVFHYENIAEYYCHSDQPTQQFFEDSALVIVDYNSAIKNGWIRISKAIDEIYLEDNSTEADNE